MNKRTIRMLLSLALAFCLLMGSAPVSIAAAVGPKALSSVSVDLSRSGSNLFKYGRVSLEKVETVHYTVVLQQKGIWPWSEYSDYEYSTGSSTTGSATYGATTAPPGGYYCRVVVYASSASFPHLEATSSEVFY